MKLFVTGGAGFIGSNFVRMALNGQLRGLENAAVTIFDALTYSGTLTNLTSVEDNPRFSFIQGDIRDGKALEAALPGHDAIVHFAAESHVDRSVSDAGIFVETNVLGTQKLLEAAKAHGISRFVHISTDEVYGSIDEGEWSEEEPLLPNSPYAASKAGSDLMVRAYHRTHGLDTSPLGVPTTTGTHHFPEKVIPLFVTNCWMPSLFPSTETGVTSEIGSTSTITAEELRLCFKKVAPAKSTTSAAEPNCLIAS